MSMDRYIEYLKRTIRNKETVTLQQENEKALSKEVAKHYGLTKEDMQELENKLIE